MINKGLVLNTLLVLAVTSICGATIGFAQGGFAQIDGDHDKFLNKQEFSSYIKMQLRDFDHIDELIEELDEDNDGKLSEAEFDNRRLVIPKIIERHKEKSDGPVEFVESYERRYKNQKPKVGDMLPSVSVFDEAGKKFEMDSTRGKYTVLVFGCLT